MSGIGGPKCAQCGRFLAEAHAVIGYQSAGYASGAYIESVRGKYGRCGADVEATREGDSGIWWAWDMWGFDDERLELHGFVDGHTGCEAAA